MLTTTRKTAARPACENRYCATCAKTTSHSVQGVTYACLRCGVIKFAVRLTYGRTRTA